MRLRVIIMAMLVLPLGLTACGGQEDSASPSPSPHVVQGTIQTLGADSLTLTNGRTFSLQGVDVVYANAPWLDPLREGMTVEVSANGSQAEKVTLNPLLTGQLLPGGGTGWQVNGIPVSYDGAVPAAEHWVMVSGRYAQSGQVEASDIAPLNQTPSWMEIEQRISELNEAAATFKLGSQPVSYKDLIVEGGAIHDGLWVEVFGRLDDQGLFHARSIEVEDDVWPDGSELEGIITYFDDVSGQLELDRQRRVWVTPNTSFEDGRRADLKLGRLVDVDVRQGAKGMQAEHIDFEGHADMPDIGYRQFELEGLANWHNNRLFINDIEFVVDAMTRLEDGLALDTLDGKWVELSGVVQSGLNLVREIEPEHRDGEISLTGFVSQGLFG